MDPRKEEFFEKITAWINKADYIDDPFSKWPLAQIRIRGWNTTIRLSLKKRELREFDKKFPKPFTIKGIDLFSIEIDKERRRQGRATTTIHHILNSIKRAETITFFAVVEVINPKLSVGLRTHFKDQLTEHNGHNKMFFWISTENRFALPGTSSRRSSLQRKSDYVPRVLDFEDVEEEEEEKENTQITIV